MLKKLLLGAWVVLLPSYSYSDSISPYYGYTPNAAANGLTWSMGDVLPTPPGLEIQNVIYSYRIQKETGEWVTVYVQNENALGNGYIFRQRDDWKPGSLGGTEINKVVPIIPNIPREAWGTGSIVTEGNGSVSEPNVIYTYRVDPCYDPQFDPNCPGYKVQVPDIYQPDIELYDATLNGDADQKQYNPDDELYAEEEQKSDEELAKEEEENKKDSKERLEKALAAADNSAMFAQALAVSQMIDTMNNAVNMNNYYAANISGGTYKDSVVLTDKQLPENKSGLRNGLAQQLLHQQMVEMQYSK